MIVTTYPSKKICIRVAKNLKTKGMKKGTDFGYSNIGRKTWAFWEKN